MMGFCVLLNISDDTGDHRYDCVNLMNKLMHDFCVSYCIQIVKTCGWLAILANVSCLYHTDVKYILTYLFTDWLTDLLLTHSLNHSLTHSLTYLNEPDPPSTRVKHVIPDYI